MKKEDRVVAKVNLIKGALAVGCIPISKGYIDNKIKKT